MFVARTCAGCLAFAVILMSSSASAQDKEDPIISAVKKGIKDKTKPFTMFVRIKVKDADVAKFQKAFAKAIKATRKEKGNSAYDLNRVAEKNEFVVYERWKSLAALESHIMSDHIQTLLKTIVPMLEGPPEVDVLVPAGE